MLLSLLQSMPSLPQEPLLQYTAALTVAVYADWLANTLKGGLAGDLVPNLLQMLAQGERPSTSLSASHRARVIHATQHLSTVATAVFAGLTHEDSAAAASLAIRHLCDACGALLGPYMDALMQLYQRIQGAGVAAASSQAGSQGLAMDEEALHNVRSPSPAVPPALAFMRAPVTNASIPVLLVHAKGACTVKYALMPD